MVDAPQGQWVVPNPQIPRSFGIMNLIVGILMVLVGFAYLAAYLVGPSLTKYVMAQVQQRLAVEKAKREATIAEMKKQEADAKTDEEKASIKVEREILEQNPSPDLAVFDDESNWNIYSDMRLAIFTFSELGSGIVLNVLLIISGVGLMGMADWARKLAIWVSWGKLVRWVSIVALTLLLVLPITTERVDKVVRKMQVQQTKVQGGRGFAVSPVPMLNLSQFAAISGAITSIFTAAVASVYPILSIWFLTRPAARAACLSRPRTAPRSTGTAPGALS